MKQNKADYLIAAQFATNAEQCGDLKKAEQYWITASKLASGKNLFYTQRRIEFCSVFKLSNNQRKNRTTVTSCIHGSFFPATCEWCQMKVPF